MTAVHGTALRLLMVLSSEPVLSLKSNRFFITVTIGYESNEDSGGNHAGCITFADPIMDWTVDKESFSLYSTGPEGHISKIDHEDYFQGSANFFEVEGYVSVVENPKFVSLDPGQRYNREFDMLPSADFEEDFQVGKKYKYQFDGGRIGWWGWGNEDDLKEVKIPVEEVADQPGEELWITASNAVEFDVVE